MPAARFTQLRNRAGVKPAATIANCQLPIAYWKMGVKPAPTVFVARLSRVGRPAKRDVCLLPMDFIIVSVNLCYSWNSWFNA